MKKFGWCAMLGLFVLWLVFPAAPSLAGDEPGSKNSSEPPQKDGVKKGGTKAKDEFQELKKDFKQIGREIKESFKEAPGKISGEAKKTGKALTKSGKEIKENTKESIDYVKKKFKD
jgi:hypothetical protein